MLRKWPGFSDGSHKVEEICENQLEHGHIPDSFG